MSIDLRFPNITGSTPEEQLSQIKSYLHQLVQQLNWALNNLQPGTGSESSGTQSPIGDISEEIFNELKALLIQSSDTLNAYYEKINSRLESHYLKQATFNEYKDEVSQRFSDLDEVYVSQTDFDAYKQEVENQYVSQTSFGEYQQQVSEDFEGLDNKYVSQEGFDAYKQEVSQNFTDLDTKYVGQTAFDTYQQEVEQNFTDLANQYVSKVDFEAYQQSMAQTIEGLMLKTDFDTYKQTNDQAVAGLQQEVATLRQMIEEITGGE